MWASSLEPSFGFSGTSGIPADRPPTTATQVSSVDSAQTAARLDAAQALGDGGSGVAQLAVGELAVAEAQGGLGVQLVDGRQEAGMCANF